MKIDSATNLYCIFGKPVRHSLSPVIHNALFEHYSLNSSYLAFEPDNIKNAVDSIKTLNIKGSSITIPYKIDVIKCIDDISPEAEKIGSVNTLINLEGKITGHNTDGYGVLQPFKERGIEITGKKVLILGNGGSARSTAFALIENNAEVIISGRSDEKIKQLEKDLIKIKNYAGSVNLQTLDNSFMENIDIIINTTPVGMLPDENAMPLDSELLNEKHIVFDIVYKPDMTKLLKNAAAKNCTVIKGINMLIFQAMKQFELWTGIIPDSEVIFNALEINPK
jgi:shikimate dehydrogenase